MIRSYTFRTYIAYGIYLQSVQWPYRC